MGLLRRRRRRLKKTRRRVWVRPINSRRCQQGDIHNLLQEMRLSDPQSHFKYLRMSKQRFDSLLQMICLRFYKTLLIFVIIIPSLFLDYSTLVSSRIFKSLSFFFFPEISPAERLALTLSYLATGNSQV